MLIQPCENEIAPGHSLVFLCPDLGSHRDKYVALEMYHLNSSPGTPHLLSGKPCRFNELKLRFIFFICKMGIMVASSHGVFVRIKR